MESKKSHQFAVGLLALGAGQAPAEVHTTGQVELVAE